MENIRLLIVDDVEDNRLILRAICRKLEGFEIFEAVDGQDSIEKCEELHPHIVLMDVMMPRLDGFQAAKIIKDRYPETIVMAVTAVIDPKMEENMASIGVSAYIRKPIDKDLIRLKIQSYAGSLSIKGREEKLFSKTAASNPFCDNVRNFKTIFTIQTIEAIMDFGIWLLARFECGHANVCTNIDMIIELLYELIHQELKKGVEVTITIEESFDEVYLSIPLPIEVEKTAKIDYLIQELSGTCMITKKMAAFRIRLISSSTDAKGCSIAPSSKVKIAIETPPKMTPIASGEVSDVEKRKAGAMENTVLRESFVHKITAAEYVATLDHDAFGEVQDLREAEEEWSSWLNTLRLDGSEDNFNHFANEVLGVYSDAISALYEFSGLSYAMVSLSTLIKANASLLAQDEAKRSQTIEFLGGFKNDLSQWIEHVFIQQDAQDIHYLDGSFFSSCMIIETIITGTQIDTGDETEIEFF